MNQKSTISEEEIQRAGIIAEQDMLDEFTQDDEKFDFSKENLKGLF